MIVAMVSSNSPIRASGASAVTRNGLARSSGEVNSKRGEACAWNWSLSMSFQCFRRALMPSEA